MSNRFVEVNITSQTKAVTQAGFGLALILSTEKAATYKEYASDSALSTIETDFGIDSETYKLANAMLSQEPQVDKIAILGVAYNNETDEPATLISALNELIKTKNDFFYLVSTEQEKEEIEALDSWIGSRSKFYFVTTTKEVVDTLKTAMSRNTIVLAHDKPEQYAAEALVGEVASLDVGSFTLTFTQLNGIEPASYDSVEIDAIEAKNAITYIRQGGVNIVSKGTTMAGEHFDVVQAEYFLEARIAERVFGLLTRVRKVPFTTNGIGMTVAEVDNVLQENVENLQTGTGIIARNTDGAPLYSITIPDINSISKNDKANRILPDIPWSATIAGAIEKVKINGVLSL